MFSLSSVEINKNYLNRLSSFNSVVQKCDERIVKIEKAAKHASQASQKKKGMLDFFKAREVSPKELSAMDLRGKYREITEFKDILEKQQNKIVDLTEKMEETTSTEEKIPIKQEILARQEIALQLEAKLLDEIDTLIGFTGEDENLTEKVETLFSEFDMERRKVVDEERKFSAILAIFQGVHHEALPQSKDVESLRKSLSEKMHLEEFIRPYNLKRTSEKDLPEVLDMLIVQIGFAEKCIEERKILELNEILTNDELTELKLYQYDAKIEYLTLKIENQYLEPGETVELFKKALQKIKEQKIALEEVAGRSTAEKSFAVYWTGKILSAAIDASTRIYGSVMGTERHNYKWETKPWGQLLISADDPLASPFFRSVNTTKEAIKKLDARVLVMEKELAVVEDDLSNRRWTLSKFGKNKVSVKKKWEEKRDILKEQIQEAKEDRNELKIALRSVFVQKIVQEIGEREQKIQELKEQSSEAQEIIDSLDEMDEEDAEIIDTQVNIIAESNLEREKLEREVLILDEGYRLQLEKYKKLSTPTRSLMEALKHYGIGRVKDYISLGFFNSDYISPHQLEVDHAFAKYGYNWMEGMKEIVVEDAPNIQYFIVSQVQRFIEFADEYPDVAIMLAPDIAVTISRLGGKDPLSYFQKRMQSKCYAQALLYQLGRVGKTNQLQNEEIYEKAKKWKAFADLIKTGPVASANIEVFNAAWKGFKRGSLLEMVTGPLAKSMESRIDNQNLRNTIKLFSPEGDRLATEIQKILSGGESQSIAQMEHNIVMVKMIGNLRKIHGDGDLPKEIYSQIDEESTAFIEKLERRGIFFKPIPDESLPVVPEDVKRIMEFRIKSLLADRVERLNVKYQTKIEKKGPLSTQAVRKMYLSEANIPQLKEEIKNMINRQFESKIPLPKDTVEDITNFYLSHIAQKLKNEWLNQAMYKAVEDEALSIWNHYETPNKYLTVNETERKYTSPKQYRTTLKPILDKSKQNLYKNIRTQLAGKMVRVEKTRDVIVDKLMDEYDLNVL